MFSISPTSAAGNSAAYQDLLQKQSDLAKKNADAINSLSTNADQDQKSQARSRVAEIKEQIEALRRMLLLFGGKDAKAVQQQLKQLASELKQAAGVLKTSPDTSVPDDTGYKDGRDAYAEQQASADAEAAGKVQASISVGAADPMRAEDEKQVEAVTQALKSLRSMTDRLVKQQEHKL